MPQTLINAMQARTAIPRHNGPERLSASDGDRTARTPSAAAHAPPSRTRTLPLSHAEPAGKSKLAYTLLARRRRHARVQARQHVEHRERALEGLRWPARPGS